MEIYDIFFTKKYIHIYSKAAKIERLNSKSNNILDLLDFLVVQRDMWDPHNNFTKNTKKETTLFSNANAKHLHGNI